jgi:hypothetical protein
MFNGATAAAHKEEQNDRKHDQGDLSKASGGLRVAGDMQALKSFMAPDAIYEMVEANAFADPHTVGPHRMDAAADRLVETFTFHNVETRTVIVDGARAAVVNRLEVAFRDRAPVASEACDL